MKIAYHIMGYNTASTEWPSLSPSEGVKELIDELFLLLDNSGEGAGDQLADRVFASDGVLNGPAGKVEGSAGQSNSSSSESP